MKINWSEIYSNSTMAKEIGHKVISKVNEESTVQTHNGVFHADDVFCTALLKYVLKKEITVKRSRAVNEKERIFVFDMGGGEFDHHQCDEYREDGEVGIFASFGKLWCTVGRTIEGLREEVWKEIDFSFVRSIDLTDNTGHMNPVNYFINSLRTTEGFDDSGFNKAVDLAYCMLSTIIQAGLLKSKELDEFEAEVSNALASSNDNDGVLELSKFYAVNKEVYLNLPYNWIIYPAFGSYTIQAVKDRLMPSEKRGLGPKDDIIFTHKGGWIGKAKTKKAALSLIEE